MENDYQKVLEQLKKGYEKSQEMLQTKKMQKIRITQEIRNLDEDASQLKYEMAILEKPRQKDRIVIRKNKLWQDIIYLIITFILPFIVIPSLTYMLATNTGLTVLISQILALISTVFFPGLIIYASLTLAKKYRQTVNDIIAAEELIKKESLAKLQATLAEKINQKKIKGEELAQAEELIATLNDDITAFAISYNTIATKFLENPTVAFLPKEEKAQTLSRHKK